MEERLKKFWQKKGRHQVIAAKHTEFVIEPKMIIGDKLNPELLKLLIVEYLAKCTKQDSGIGANIEATPDKLIIKSPKGRPLVIVRDKKLIDEYLAAQA